MNKPYVDKRDEGYWVAGARVSLDSIIFAFLDGLSPETIATECFPTLSLEQVYGAITYYLAHCSEIDTYLYQIRLLKGCKNPQAEAWGYTDEARLRGLKAKTDF